MSCGAHLGAISGRSLPRITRPIRINKATLAMHTKMECSEQIIEQIFTSLEVVRRDGNIIPLEVYIPREEGNLLYSLVCEIRPSTALEIGMANGISTLFIARGLRDNGSGRHIAIDPFQTSQWGDAVLHRTSNRDSDDILAFTYLGGKLRNHLKSSAL